MSPKSLFFQFLIRISFRSRRKPRPPSPTTSLTLVDSSVQYKAHSLSENECTIAVDFDPDLWRNILSYCEVVDIIRIGMACRSLASATNDPRVWYAALLDISHDRRLPCLRSHIKSLPSSALRQKAILLARLDRLPRGLHLMPSHYPTTRLSLLVSTVWGISFLPGGEWLVVLCQRAGKDGVMLCKANDPFGQPSTYSSVPGGNLTGMCMSTGDEGDLLMVLRSDCPNRTRLGVYVIHSSENPPRLEKVRTITVQKFENFAALGSYIAYGWIDRSHPGPRHLIKIMKFESCYRKLTEYSTVEVIWEIGKHSHSYGLRIADSGITLLVSSTALVAAYKVPPMVSASVLSEPATVEPFWCFPCSYMHPRAVYLVPSLPAVDAPSIVILYKDRCLFIQPNFDTEPPGIHPTYFATYRHPRELKQPMLLGPQRAFWDLGHGRVGVGLLPTPVEPAFWDHGVLDTTGINALEGDLAHSVHPLVYGEGQNRRVARAAWDEESGRLALFPKTEYHRGEDMSIVIVDFMH